jgi:hypothetical protein
MMRRDAGVLPAVVPLSYVGDAGISVINKREIY